MTMCKSKDEVHGHITDACEVLLQAQDKDIGNFSERVEPMRDTCVLLTAIKRCEELAIENQNLKERIKSMEYCFIPHLGGVK